VAVPAGGFPAMVAPTTVTKKKKWSYYQNVCTQSYSMYCFFAMRDLCFILEICYWLYLAIA